MYSANYDPTTGKILGFYLEEIHSNIPKPVIKLTEEEHNDFLNKDQNYKVISGVFTFIKPKEPSTEEIKTKKILILDNEYQPKFLKITQSWANANMDNNTELMNIKQQEKQDLIKKYEEEKEKINNG